MKKILFMIPALVGGCVSSADFQPPTDHPAHASATDPRPPTAADPFDVAARPIETEPESMHDHAGNDMADIVPATQAANSSYPLTTCPVTGVELGTMGEPIDVDLDGRVVKVCCGGCVATVQADPQKYLAILDDAASEGGR